jgi:DNA-binding MarR family transcriptional regulator
MEASTGGGYGYSLIHAAQTWRTEATEVLRPHGLTVPQFLVVIELYRRARHDRAPLTQADLSTHLGMDANTTSQVVRGLERRQLVLRTRHPEDARAMAITLTPVGRDRARDASAAARAHNDRYFGVLTSDQLVALDQLLTIISTESEKRSCPSSRSKSGQTGRSRSPRQRVSDSARTRAARPTGTRP